MTATATDADADAAGTTTQPYRIRPGRRSDIPNAVKVWRAAFGRDQIVDLIVPNHREYPATLQAYVTRLFYTRWWTPNYDLDVICEADNEDEIVALSWWKRPNAALSFYERWISPCTCLVNRPHHLKGVSLSE